MQELYDRIKALCDEKGYTIQTLEQLSHVGRGSIGKWRASKPSADSLYRVACILDTSVDYLLTGMYKEIIPASGIPADMREYLQQIKDDPSARMMFDLAKGATVEELRATVAFLKALRETRK